MIKLKIWFRSLSRVQVSFVYAWIVIVILLTCWHNPSEGYTRTFAYIKTSSEQVARAKSKELFSKYPKPLNQTSYFYETTKTPETAYMQKAYTQNAYDEEAYDGYLYQKVPSLWTTCFYCYSNAFKEKSVPARVMPVFPKLENLGYFCYYIMAVTIVAFFFVWLTGIRSQQHEIVNPSST